MKQLSIPCTSGGYKTILADPPWRFQNRTGKVAPEHKRLRRYDTMTLQEICDLPVAVSAAKDAHLYYQKGWPFWKPGGSGTSQILFGQNGGKTVARTDEALGFISETQPNSCFLVFAAR